MNPVILLALGLYALAEVALASLLAAAVGWGWVLVAMAALVVVGAAVMRRAGMQAARALQDGTQDGRAAPAAGTGTAVGDASLQFVAGVLIAVPGFLTSAIGLLMLVRPVRRLLGATVVAWFLTRVRRRGMTIVQTTGPYGERITRVVPGDVVEGEVVRHDDAPEERPDPPALSP